MPVHDEHFPLCNGFFRTMPPFFYVYTFQRTLSKSLSSLIAECYREKTAATARCVRYNSFITIISCTYTYIAYGRFDVQHYYNQSVLQSLSLSVSLNTYIVFSYTDFISIALSSVRSIDLNPFFLFFHFLLYLF